jgi:hypothetical protein
MTVDRDRLARIILSGMNDIEEWRLGDPALAAAKGYPREYPAEVIDDCGIVFVDVTLDAATGDSVCHEVNGPNAVGSDALTGESTSRARNEASQAARRARELGHLQPDGSLRRQVVALHAHQHWTFFRTGGEFYPRVARFADCLEELLPGQEIACYSAGETLGDERVAIVIGDVPAIAANIAIDPETQGFRYRDRPVIFIGNPNLLSELIRTGKFAREKRDRAHPSLRVLHAWRLAGLIHDKSLQQDLFAQTGIRPLRHFTARSIADAVGKAREMLADGPVVLKPSDTSGGTGVTVLVPQMSDDKILERIETLLADCLFKYGDNCNEMVLPIRGFEFVRSTGYPIDGADHLWDLRIAVLFEPGKAVAYPVSLRLAPEPFDPASFHLDRRQWVSNVSGRRETLLKSGMDDETLEAVGMTAARLDQAMKACVLWTGKAWDWSARNGTGVIPVYEDSKEEPNKPFYDSDRFVAG